MGVFDDKRYVDAVQDGELETSHRYVVSLILPLYGCIQPVLTAMTNRSSRPTAREQPSCSDSRKRQHSPEHVYIFQFGDQVSLKNVKRLRKGVEHSPVWVGPYTVVGIFDDGICVLQSPTGERRHQHMDQLRRFDQTDTSRSDLNKLKPPTTPKTTRATNSAIWLPALNLTMRDRHTIQYDNELNDKIMDAAQSLIRTQFGVEGLDSTLLSQTKSGYGACTHQCIQIHFDEDRQHWVTSSTTRFRVELCDSLMSSHTMSYALKTQLIQRYGSLSAHGELPIFVLPVDQQINSTDCGVYAIANAIEFIANDGDPTSKYEASAMRAHLIKCFESWEMTPFPKRSKRAGASRGKVKQYTIKINEI